MLGLLSAPRGEDGERLLRAAAFATEFKSYKDAQESVGDFRECRGSVGSLCRLQSENFIYQTEIAEMEGFMGECANAKSLVPPIQGRIRQFWDPIEVSDDTAETGAGGGAEAVDEEVNQPTDSFGVSMSRFLDLDY